MSLLKSIANNAQVNVDFLDEPKQWKSLDEYAQSPEFETFLHREFPEGAAYLDDAVSRRNFIKLIGASLAFAGLSSCRMPKENILPYVNDPEGVMPGRAQYYATWFRQGSQAWPILARSSDGRPTKVEGNASSTATGKATTSYAQAAILSMFDQDRLKNPKLNNEKKSWKDFSDFWMRQFDVHKVNGGKNLYVVAGASSSPSFMKQKTTLKKTLPNMHWYTHETYCNINELKGLDGYQANYDLSSAKVIVSFNSDFMQHHDQSLKMSRDFAKGRKVEKTNNTMNRLYVYETAMSLTGSNADHRQALRVNEIESMIWSLAKRLNVVASMPGDATVLSEKSKKHLDALLKDLLSHKGSSALVVGQQHSADVHALVHKINMALSNAGKTVSYVQRSVMFADEQDSLRQLAANALNHEDYTVVVINSNPVYDFVGKQDVLEFLNKAKHKIALSYDVSETTAWADWQLPLAHDLESWSDAESINGELGIVQPLIEPLFNAKSDLEFMAMLYGVTEAYSFSLIRQTWQETFAGKNFDQSWKDLLNKGVLQSNQKRVNSISGLNVKPKQYVQEQGKFDVFAVPSSSTFDGRYANNAWLQETPDPISKITWGNPALVSVAFAKKLNVKDGQLVELEGNGNKVRLPIMIVPGTVDDTFVVSLGYGRKTCGAVGQNVGANVLPILPLGHLSSTVSAKVLNESEKVATTQNHGSMEDRPIVRSASLKHFLEHPTFAKEMVEHPPLESLWKEKEYNTGYQWGMSVDLNACIGCTSCALACQSENNIPVVGKEQVLAGRDMNWMRIDRYFEGSPDNPQVLHQPVMCQHCENAPCEQVCPVNATVHDDEGLNAMVYNRCIGTRYCSNNCPYKVRRFNFLDYTGDTPELQKMAFNPNVTVRSRGVMEKCTFCVQRINEKKFSAKVEGRDLVDGEVKTACQEVCPTEAISFGNILEKNSQVVQEKSSNRNYALLEELNAKPRTTYSAKLRNPNPELEGI